MPSPSVIELSRSAYYNNLDFIREQVGPDVKIDAVMKGNAYGHGIHQMIPLALDYGIDHFSFFSVQEAREAHELIGDKADLMILGLLDGKRNLHWAVENGIEFYVFELEVLKTALEAARQIGKKARIHVELETGMNRTGFTESDLEQVIELIRNNGDSLDVMGICTHFAGAESIANYMRVKRQYKKFQSIKLHLKKLGITPRYYHTACSAATMRYPKTQMDMVRIGIMQYGFWPNREVFINYSKEEDTKKDPLKPVIEWKSEVMSVKNVQAGEFIGYGTTYLANSKMKVAIIPVGYAYGFPRNLSNQGRVLIRGRRVGVVGTVNMNMLTVDVTGTEASVGDEVVLIGKQGDLFISAASFSEMSSQLNYESLLRLPRSLTREIVN